MTRAPWIRPESTEAQQFRRKAMTLSDYDPAQKRLSSYTDDSRT